MADKHYTRIEAEIEFADGKVRTVKPLTIKSLRKFVKIIDGLDTSGDSIDDETISRMVEAAQIVVAQTDAELAKNLDQLEDSLDMDVFGKIMTVAMGNRIVDPNV